MLSIFFYQEKANENYFEILFYSDQNSQELREKDRKYWHE